MQEMKLLLANFGDWPGYSVINDEINPNKVCLIYKCPSALHVCPQRYSSLYVSNSSATTSCYGDITTHQINYKNETGGGGTLFLYFSHKTLELLACWY